MDDDTTVMSVTVSGPPGADVTVTVTVKEDDGTERDIAEIVSTNTQLA